MNDDRKSPLEYQRNNGTGKIYQWMVRLVGGSLELKRNRISAWYQSTSPQIFINYKRKIITE